MFRSAVAYVRSEGLRLLRFALSGVAATALYAIFVVILLAYTSIRPDLVSAISYLLAVVFSYVLQSRFTFRSNEDSPRQIGTFLAVSLVGLSISYAMMWIFHLWLGFSAFGVAIAICIIIPAVNYIVLKRIVFTTVTPPPAKNPPE